MYSEEGELNFLVPRVGASLSGMGVGNERSVSVSGDLSIQLLKNAYVDAGLKYQYLVKNEEISTILSFSLLGALEDFTLAINLGFDFLGENRFLPSIVFTYSN